MDIETKRIIPFTIIKKRREIIGCVTKDVQYWYAENYTAMMTEYQRGSK